MASRSKPADATETPKTFDQALAMFDKCQTERDVWQAAIVVEPLLDTFTDAEVEALRERAQMARIAVSGMVKTEELSGRPVEIRKARTVNTKFGLTFLLEGVYLDGDNVGEKFRCWCPGSPEGPAQRFFSEMLPKDFPISVVMTKGVHPTNPNHTMWEVNPLIKREGRNTPRLLA